MSTPLIDMQPWRVANRQAWAVLCNATGCGASHLTLTRGNAVIWASDHVDQHVAEQAWA